MSPESHAETNSEEPAAAVETAVMLEAVEHVYGGTVHALGPIDLALRQGEFFATIGPSGCGKTTRWTSLPV